MRIVLLYPPPWKIPQPGAPLDFGGDGPPAGFAASDIDADFWQMPYGLLSLAAQARRAGHQVKVANLSAWAWSEVQHVARKLDADLFGLSCFTANRRGVALVARCIRQHHPRAHIIVGGAHATALPTEMLEHHPEIDSIALGEGEATLLELAERLEHNQPVVGLAGAAYRAAGRPQLGPQRPPLEELDALAPVHEYYDSHLFMTARGCPGRCTFCAKNTVWGSRYRSHSVEYVLDALQQALSRLPLKMLTLKDDTFTANRRRALALCQGIRQRGINFIWSCDTRADALDVELLKAMRLAGCQRLSLGVESGSPEILRNIRKQVAPEAIVAATQMAKQFGIQVRYFMMLGNRGETAATFQQSLAFVQHARPHQSIFACLSVYPGTQDYRDLKRAGVLDPEVYFTEDFQELKTPFDASAEDTALMSDWFCRQRGIQTHFTEGVAEYQTILERLGEHAAAHVDLGGAHYHAGQLDLAEQHLQHALGLGYPLPELVHNYLACIAARRGDVHRMQQELSRALQGPPHPVLLQNLQTVSTWRARGGSTEELASRLKAHHDFQLLEPAVQPLLPGPLPDDFTEWR